MIKYMGDSDNNQTIQSINSIKANIKNIENSTKFLEFYNDKINMDYSRTIIL